MISFQVAQNGLGSKELDRFVDTLRPRGLAKLNEVGGRAAQNEAISYHREFDKKGGWRGPNYLGRGTGEGSDFGAKIAGGWFFKKADATGAIISNNAEHYAFKVKGGIIRPKVAKALTIPLVAEARGMRAFNYEAETGNELFIPRGRSVLAIKVGDSIRPIYALVKQAVHRPWPNALPPEDLLGEAYVDTVSDYLIQRMQELAKKGGKK